MSINNGGFIGAVHHDNNHVEGKPLAHHQGYSSSTRVNWCQGCVRAMLRHLRRHSCNSKTVEQSMADLYREMRCPPRNQDSQDWYTAMTPKIKNALKYQLQKLQKIGVYRETVEPNSGITISEWHEATAHWSHELWPGNPNELWGPPELGHNNPGGNGQNNNSFQTSNNSTSNVQGSFSGVYGNSSLLVDLVDEDVEMTGPNNTNTETCTNESQALQVSMEAQRQLQARNEALMSQIRTLTENTGDFDNRMGQQARQTQSLPDEVRQLKQQEIPGLQGEILDLRSKNGQLKQDAAGLEAQVCQLKTELSRGRQAHATAEDKYRDDKRNLESKARTDMDRLRDEHADDASKLRDKLSKAERDRDDMERQMKNAESEKSRAQQRLADVEKRGEVARDAERKASQREREVRDEASRRERDLQSQVDDLERQLEDQNQSRQVEKDQLRQDLQAEIDRLTHDKTALDRDIRQMSADFQVTIDEAAKLREDLRAADANTEALYQQNRQLSQDLALSQARAGKAAEQMSPLPSRASVYESSLASPQPTRSNARLVGAISREASIRAPSRAESEYRPRQNPPELIRDRDWEHRPSRRQQLMRDEDPFRIDQAAYPSTPTSAPRNLQDHVPYTSSAPQRQAQGPSYYSSPRSEPDDRGYQYTSRRPLARPPSGQTPGRYQVADDSGYGFYQNSQIETSARVLTPPGSIMRTPMSRSEGVLSPHSYVSGQRAPTILDSPAARRQARVVAGINREPGASGGAASTARTSSIGTEDEPWTVPSNAEEDELRRQRDRARVRGAVEAARRSGTRVDWNKLVKADN